MSFLVFQLLSWIKLSDCCQSMTLLGPILLPPICGRDKDLWCSASSPYFSLTSNTLSYFAPSCLFCHCTIIRRTPPPTIHQLWGPRPLYSATMYANLTLHNRQPPIHLPNGIFIGETKHLAEGADCGRLRWGIWSSQCIVTAMILMMLNWFGFVQSMNSLWWGQSIDGWAGIMVMAPFSPSMQ